MRTNWIMGGAAVMVAAAGVFAPAAPGQDCRGEVGHWAFEGDARDVSGHGHDGFVWGGALFVPGPSGMALRLDGVDDFVSVANAPGLNPSPAISISAWYRPVSFSGTGNDALVDKGAVSHSPPYYQYHLGVTGDVYGHDSAAFGFNVNGAVGAGTRAGFWIPGRWYHIVGVYDGAFAKMYVDGELVQENQYATAIPDYGRPVYFGRFVNLDRYLPGDIDEIRIFSRALSADEAMLLHERPDGGAVVLPVEADTCPGGTVALRAVSLENGVGYQWRKHGVEVEGATSATLTIEHAFADSEGVYDCVMNTTCGVLITSGAVVHVCAGEFNCDGGIDGGDVESFFALWEAGDPSADVNVDGGVDGADVEYFFARWEAGC